MHVLVLQDMLILLFTINHSNPHIKLVLLICLTGYIKKKDKI